MYHEYFAFSFCGIQVLGLCNFNDIFHIQERQPIRTICKSEILDARISFGLVECLV